jgi:DivIVA domain-containing protein
MSSEMSTQSGRPAYPTFPRAPRWVRGYDRGQVDRYLAQARLALATRPPTISAGEIRKVGFDLVHRGYEVSAIDAYLDELELEAVRLAGREVGGTRLTEDLDELRARTEGPRGRRFPRVGKLRRGYASQSVDEFLGRIARALVAEPASPGELEERITQVRTVVFPPRRGGYDEDAVDDFLDKVVDGLLLRAAAADAGGHATR